MVDKRVFCINCVKFDRESATCKPYREDNWYEPLHWEEESPWKLNENNDCEFFEPKEKK